MTSIKASARVRIIGTTNAWSLAPSSALGAVDKECLVALEILGNPETGYHLVKRPTGFFTADDWFETKEEALKAALEMFGIRDDAWTEGDK